MIGKNKPRVLLDVDGVCSDFVGAWLPIINQYEKNPEQKIKRSDINEWEVIEALGKIGRFSTMDLAGIKKDCHDATQAENFCASLEVLEDAKKYVPELLKVAEVFVVTSPWHTKHWVVERNEWLYRHFGIKSSQILHGSAKHICAGDFLIDDKTSTVVAWAEEPYNGVGVVFATPHNVNDEIPVHLSATARVVRTACWSSILSVIDRLGGQQQRLRRSSQSA